LKGKKMAFNEELAKRIENVFNKKNIRVESKKFMGGYCFFLNEKMCVGLDIDKKTNKDRLMSRIGIDAMENSLKKRGCRPMDITGRPMKGFVFVDPEGYESDEDLSYWIQLAVDYNPLAKSSKKKLKTNNSN
jgi:hypothetical protein